MKFQIGDEVDIRVRVVDVRNYYRCRVVGYEGTALTPFEGAELAAGKLVERPLRVGDTVRLGDVTEHFAGDPLARGVVLALDVDEAWVYFSGDRCTYRTENLVRVSA